MNKILSRLFNIVVVYSYPRHSTRIAKELFGSKPIKVVEIGTYYGDNAKNILDELNVEKFFVIDPYEFYEEFYKESYLLDKDRDKIISEDSLKAFNKAKRMLNNRNIKFIKKTSDDAINDIPENIDFIYIDGNHEYEFVKRDIENYYKKVKSGGILAGHDISHSTVLKAVCEFSINNNLKLEVKGNDWWIIKGANKQY